MPSFVREWLASCSVNFEKYQCQIETDFRWTMLMGNRAVFSELWYIGYESDYCFKFHKRDTTIIGKDWRPTNLSLFIQKGIFSYCKQGICYGCECGVVPYVLNMEWKKSLKFTIDWNIRIFSSNISDRLIPCVAEPGWVSQLGLFPSTIFRKSIWEQSMLASWDLDFVVYFHD